jgi:hypothetical protein
MRPNMSRIKCIDWDLTLEIGFANLQPRARA